MMPKKDKLEFTKKVLDKKFPKGTYLEYHMVYEGEHAPSMEEDVSGKTPREVLNGVMKEARISNADYVYWEGAYQDERRLLNHKNLVWLAVHSSKNKKLRDVS